MIAYLNRNDPHDCWAAALMKQVRSPMLPTEPVLTEVAHFLRADRLDVDPCFKCLSATRFGWTSRLRHTGRGSAPWWGATTKWTWPTRRLSL